MPRINVTKSFLPPLEEYTSYLKEIWQNEYLTNQGPLLNRFEEEVKKYLGVSNFQFISNGTVALQIALNAHGITDGEIITTPFSYVATTSAILWERCRPVFVDIEPETYCIDADKIEAAITSDTKAILAVHVFGFPCDVEKIESIARKHDLKVIYDAAHCFGVVHKGRSIFAYGDISTVSFHATKVFHTIEGGGVFASDPKIARKLDLIKKFGHEGEDHYMPGINAKASEFQAAMGLCNLKHVNEIIGSRKKIYESYDMQLKEKFYLPSPSKDTSWNFGYCPVVFSSEDALLHAMKKLQELDIYPRRYFYPALNTLPYVDSEFPYPVAEKIAKTIVCLPLFPGLDEAVVDTICKVLVKD